ncbi:unnamed protein product [Lactuca saligna]|uniref:Uncharacterized protein n=1 Tax=Lactuca saligna TaxID=75948 RepID=A0AA35YKY1_LACSI|nr:unnamed protein product [Lactuca saligna]
MNFTYQHLIHRQPHRYVTSHSQTPLSPVCNPKFANHEFCFFRRLINPYVIDFPLEILNDEDEKIARLKDESNENIGNIERRSEIYLNGNYTKRRKGSRGLQLEKLIKGINQVHSCFYNKCSTITIAGVVKEVATILMQVFKGHSNTPPTPRETFPFLLISFDAFFLRLLNWCYASHATEMLLKQLIKP